MPLWAFLLGRTTTATTATTHNIDIPVAHIFTHIYIYIYIYIYSYESSIDVFWEFSLFCWHSVVRGDHLPNKPTYIVSFHDLCAHLSTVDDEPWHKEEVTLSWLLLFSLLLESLGVDDNAPILFWQLLSFFWTLHFIWLPPIDIRCRSFSDLSVTTMIAYYYFYDLINDTHDMCFLCVVFIHGPS